MERIFEFILNHPLNVISFLAMVALLIFYESKQRGKALSPNELVREINHNNALIIDLRPNQAFRDGHILSAMNIPYEKIKELPKQIKKYSDRSIVLVCANGRHSTNAQSMMKKEGITTARLTGGLLEWQAANMPLTKGTG